MASPPPPHSAAPPPPPPSVRVAEAADAAALGALDRRCWSTLHSVQPRPAPPYRPFFDARRLPEHCLVAELGSLGPVGYARVERSTPLACHAHVRQIQGLLVDERARRRGVGRALLAAACEHARRQGAERITLRVLGHNAAARALYAAEGFAVEGVLPGEYLLDGGYADDVLMGRRLG